MLRAASTVAAVGLLTALTASGAAEAKGFKYGVTSADVSSNSALIWTRSDKPAQLTLEVSTSNQFPGFISRSVKSKSSHDNAVTLKLKGLKPATAYFYRFTSAAGQSP